MPNAAKPVYKIEKFDATTISPTSTVLIIGPRETGKSILQNDLMYHIRDKFDYGVAMSPTKDTLVAWRGKLPPSSIYNKYREDIVQAMLQKQERSENDERRLLTLFLLLDDCMYEKRLLTTECMREMFMNGRHKRIFFMNTVQYMMDIPRAIRSCIDYVFVMRDPILSARKSLYENFFGCFPTFADFNRTMSACTTNFDCMVFCKKSKNRGTRVEDNVFWYRANPELTPYRLCRGVFWYLDQLYTKNEHGEGNANTADNQMITIPPT